MGPNVRKKRSPLLQVRNYLGGAVRQAVLLDLLAVLCVQPKKRESPYGRFKRNVQCMPIGPSACVTKVAYRPVGVMSATRHQTAGKYYKWTLLEPSEYRPTGLKGKSQKQQQVRRPRNYNT